MRRRAAQRQTWWESEPDPTGGWVWQAGFTEYRPYTGWTRTRLGARVAGRRVARRLRRTG